jgi:hypothetical protein
MVFATESPANRRIGDWQDIVPQKPRVMKMVASAAFHRIF